MGNIFEVVNGSLWYRTTNCRIKNPAIVLDTNSGTIHKWGDNSIKEVKGYFEEYIEMLSKAGIRGTVLIDLKGYRDFLKIEDICSILNYGCMCSANPNFIKLFGMGKEELKMEIKGLQERGF